MLFRKLVKFSFLIVLASHLGCGRSEGDTDKDSSRDIVNEDNKYAANFKGFRKINRIINDRLIKSGDSFSIANYLEDPEAIGVSYVAPSLKNLLGKNEGTGGTSGYVNAKPNSINMLLWYLVFSGLGDEVTRVCDSSKKQVAYGDEFSFNHKFKQTLSSFCDGSRSTDTLASIWSILMQYDSTEIEYQGWRAYIQGEDFAKLKEDEAIVALIVAAYFNPYFLVNH